MSIIIFLVTAVLSGVTIWFFDGGDSVPVFALSVIIGLGAANWYCQTRDVWELKKKPSSSSFEDLQQ